MMKVVWVEQLSKRIKLNCCMRLKKHDFIESS